MGNNVFQLGEFVDPYWVASSNDLEENSNFCITNNILVNVDAEKLNVVLNSSRHTQVDEDDDSDEINIQDAMEMRMGQLTRRKQFWLICTTRIYNAINYNVIFMDKIHFNVMTMMLIYYWMTRKYLFYYCDVNWYYCVVHAAVNLSIYRIDR